MAVIFDNAGVSPVTLPNLVIAEKQVPQKVEAAVAWTKGGKQIRWERIIKSVPLTLYGGDNWGWMDQDQLDAMQVYADQVNPATPYVLNYNGALYNVKFRFEDPPVIAHEPLSPCVTGSAWHKNVSVKFMWILP